MNTITVDDVQPTTEAKGQRTPFGQRARVELNQTVLRVVGKESKIPTLDVAAFQSFAD